MACVNKDDFYILNKYPWRINKNKYRCYARTDIKDDNGVFRTKSMHNIILNTPNGMICDHVNGNGLDNRRSNLRCVTYSQNRMNAGKNIGESKYKGVFRSREKWCASIYVNNKRIYIGYYESDSIAAKAYNDAAIKYFGEFARLNVINE